jgi:hypothetical protein
MANTIFQLVPRRLLPARAPGLLPIISPVQDFKYHRPQLRKVLSPNVVFSPATGAGKRWNFNVAGNPLIGDIHSGLCGIGAVTRLPPRPFGEFLLSITCPVC